MSNLLQPGMCVPEFDLPAANLDTSFSLTQSPSRKVILVFFPRSFENAVVERLAEYQDRLSDFEGQGAIVIGISDAAVDDLRSLSKERSIEFPLLSDANPSQVTARNYGVLSEDQQVLPTVFVTDDEALVRRVYESGKYPDLPNPAMVVRAIRKLTGVPRPRPVTPDDWKLGSLGAPVVLIEYADYQCEACREAYRLLRQIIPMYDDKVLWIHRHLPLRHSHPLAQQAAEAAEAAGAQGKFWEMHDRLFAAEGALERDHLIAYAAEIGLDMDRFRAELDSRCYQEAVNEDFRSAVRNGIKLPPMLFVNGILFQGSRTLKALCERIEALLACTLSVPPRARS